MSNNETVGISVRFLPGICSFEFRRLQLQTPNLTPQQYSELKNDPGNFHGVRIYQIRKKPYILYDRTPHLLKKYKANLTTHIPQVLLPSIYENNATFYKTHFALLGLNSSNHTDLESRLIGVPLEVYLAGIWALLEVHDLTEISPTDKFGNAQTNIGKLQINSR